MTRALLTIGCALAAALFSGGAFADAGAADACAAKLSPGAKAIFDAAAPEFAASADPRGLVKSKTVGLVKAGTIKQAEARGDAMAAGGCLKKLR